MATSPPKCLEMPLNFPHKLLMGPGPSNCPPRVLAAGALPLLGHLHPEFTKIMDDVKAGIQYLFQTKNQLTLAISGTGHAAMEAACCNIIEPRDEVLVCVNGVWGARFADMAQRHDAVVHKLERPLGEVFSLTEIESALKKFRPKLMFVTHGESSGATLQPLEGLGKLCHRYGCLLLVDSVAAAGGVPLYMDKWEIDIMYTGAQKVLGSPPGASPISFNDKAWNVIKARKTPVRSFYFDMNWLANYWGCDGQPRKYHHTGPITSVFQLREGLAIVAEEGLETSWKRHKECAELLHKGLAELNMKLLVSKPEWRLPTVTGVYVPDGFSGQKLINHAMQKYKVEVSPGLGNPNVIRIGLMGYNARPENARLVLKALGEALAQSSSKL